MPCPLSLARLARSTLSQRRCRPGQVTTACVLPSSDLDAASPPPPTLCLPVRTQRPRRCTITCCAPARELSLARCISTRGHSPALQLPAAGVVRSGSWPEKARPRSNVKSFRPQHRTLQSTQHHNIPLHQGIPRPVAIHCAPLARPSPHQFAAHRPPLLGRLRTFACLDRSLLSSLARVLAIDCIVPAWTFKGVK